jgi:putative salt-induced outer membrane protein
MFKKKIRLLPLILLFSAAVNVSAHEITLKNGDRLSGIVISRDRDSVVLETQYAGRVRIAMEYIETIDMERPVTNYSSTGQPAARKPDAEAVPAAAVKPDVKPELKNAQSNSAAQPKLPAAAAGFKSTPRLFGNGPFFGIADGWEGTANIGFSYTTGNSKTSTLATGIRASKSGRNDKLTAYVRSLLNNNRKAFQRTTQNAVWGGFRYDRDINARMFGFGSWDFERDRPKRLNFRSVIGGGIGHHMIKNDRTELDLMAGLAWNRAWQIGPDTDTPEALGASVLKHRFNDRIKVQNTFTFYQDVTAASKFRYIFDASFSADITKRIGWQISIGDRYNNRPIGAAERNDFLLTTGIKWNFGKKG